MTGRGTPLPSTHRDSRRAALRSPTKGTSYSFDIHALYSGEEMTPVGLKKKDHTCALQPFVWEKKTQAKIKTDSMWGLKMAY